LLKHRIFQCSFLICHNIAVLEVVPKIFSSPLAKKVYCFFPGIYLTNDCFMRKFLPTLPQKRCAELNRRDVDEKAEHLRLLSWLTGLITSFTMTSPIEFNVDPNVIAIVCCSTLLFPTDLKYK
jgi:hypothetical protein